MNADPVRNLSSPVFASGTGMASGMPKPQPAARHDVDRGVDGFVRNPQRVRFGMHKRQYASKWNPVFEVHGQHTCNRAFGPGRPLEQPESERPVSVPSAGYVGHPGEKGRWRGAGSYPDRDRNLGSKATGNLEAHVGRERERGLLG